MKYHPFLKAVPVWAENLENEILITLGLYTKVKTRSDRILIRVATSGYYRIFVDGRFLFWGPARAAHGFFRVDEIPLKPEKEETEVAIEVVNAGVNSYECPGQPGFIQAEIADGERILSATGESGFEAVLLKERVRKIQRYSFQRTFAEAYRLSPDYTLWRIGRPGKNTEPIHLVPTGFKVLIERGIPLNSFPKVIPDRILSSGTFAAGVIPESYRKDRSLVWIGDPESGKLGGFPEEELEWHLSDEAQEIKNTTCLSRDEPYTGKDVLGKNEFGIFSLPCEKTGFLKGGFHCSEEASIRIYFDEILTPDGDVDPVSRTCCNVLRLDLEPGDYEFQTISPLSCKYLKVLAVKGRISISDLELIEVICPQPVTIAYEGEDPKMKAIFDAARETFLQNSSDIFMDCPSRERAGWLCDSFFTARAEWEFTGDNVIEKNFLENYLLPESFDDLPKGMVPMCYPSDHTNHVFIPNWAMWLVLELEDRMFNRKKDPEFVLLFRKRVYDLLDWFKQYENRDGLLERLPSWVFVEWSEANNLVQDINFPTNMLYARTLKAAGHIFSDDSLEKKAERLQSVIREQSFDGEFFLDNLICVDGKAESSGKHTETCQYYAFFCETATPELYPELWEKLIKEFGPNRMDRKIYPEIYPSNAFIGNFLRLTLLDSNGYYSLLSDEMKDYFYYMASRTGTLWEHVDEYASCNHGFASSAVRFICHIDQGCSRRT